MSVRHSGDHTTDRTTRPTRHDESEDAKGQRQIKQINDDAKYYSYKAPMLVCMPRAVENSRDREKKVADPTKGSGVDD
eukprot:scaffold13826_cov50-Attheya_sp.AAC.3